MTASIEPIEDSKASRLMRKAILRALHCPPDDPDEAAADKLEQVARSHVDEVRRAPSQELRGRRRKKLRGQMPRHLPVKQLDGGRPSKRSSD
jgi:hypothetical protein